MLRFVDDDCTVVGLENVPTRGPILLAAPHFGYYALAALKIGRIFGNRLRVFYNPPERNAFSPIMNELFARCSMEQLPLMNDRRGVLRAVRHLQEDGIVGIMPDVFGSARSNVYVPLFGRFCEAMTGTAFLSTKTSAAVVPMHCERAGKGYKLFFHEPVRDFCEERQATRQDLYILTRALFESMEAIIRGNPASWTFWVEFANALVETPKVPSSRADAYETLTEWNEFLSASRDPNLRTLSACVLPALKIMGRND